LIDARSAEEFAAGHVYNAINVPHDSVDALADRLPATADAPIVTYGKSGKRARMLQERLFARRYTNVRVLGPAQMFMRSRAVMCPS
jgi:phage shock protein E